MRVVTTHSAVLGVCAFALCAVGGASIAASSVEAPSADKKPSVMLRATPVSGFAPLRVVLTASLVGGPDDYQDFYCPTIEWDWDDGTKSESKVDCEPYEAGKSEINRSYTMEHRFNIGGEHRVQFRIKQKKKTVGSASVMVRVQPGIRDGGPWVRLPDPLSWIRCCNMFPDGY